MLKTIDEKCENFLKWTSDKYGNFLDRLYNGLEPTGEYIYKYPSLSICISLGIVFILILSCILN